MSQLEDLLLHKITKRKEEGAFRELKSSHERIDFSSNDYLGFARDEKLFRLISQRIETINGPKNGATGSRLLSGNTAYTQEVERKLAHIFRSEAALIFNSGYTANLAVLSSIPQRGDTILYDELCHASLKDGARLSLATRHAFKHNNLNDLEKKIRHAKGRIYIVIESIYSMDGDESPLRELVSLAERYDATIILDEAHSTGVVGDHGSGLAVSLEIHDRIGIRIYTFGKAMGTHGACVAGSANTIDYLVNFARPFIYTTALPPHSIAAIDCAFAFLRENSERQQVLKEKIRLFLKTITGLPVNRTPSTSAIQTIIFPGNDNVKKAAHLLQQNGFDIRPILSPTVAEGSERLRICLHSFNTDAEITSLSEALKKLTAVV